MRAQTEHLDRFFDAIARLTFWRRLFGWRVIRALSYEAFNEYASLKDSTARMEEDLEQVHSRLSLSINDLEHTRSQSQYFEQERVEARVTIGQLRESLTSLTKELTTLRDRDTRRDTEVQSALSALNAIREQLAAERAAEREAEDAEARDRIERMKKGWQEHEQHVRERIKLICQRHTLEYVEAVPFHGTPDNTIRVGEEYVVFDAKSPANDDPRNFPGYLKVQAEAARKYATQDRVSRDVFFVIPSQTLSSISLFVHNFPDHDVFVITVDALEPVILTLKRIQDLEFAVQVSPEEREDIIRVLARFVHMMKRRIQVDQFFSRQFLDALSMTETELNTEMQAKIQEVERTLKLNPPQDQRAKLLTQDELQKNFERIVHETEGRGIAPKIPPSTAMHESDRADDSGIPK